MIRLFKQTDLNQVMAIWLTGNQQSHDFINPQYWEEQLDSVSQAIIDADVLVYTDEHDTILAFIGLIDNYIAGLFVHQDHRSKGLGHALIEKVKRNKKQLTLAVYERNKGATDFYLREGFSKIDSRYDPTTQEKEWLLEWKKDKKIG